MRNNPFGLKRAPEARYSIDAFRVADHIDGVADQMREFPTTDVHLFKVPVSRGGEELIGAMVIDVQGPMDVVLMRAVSRSLMRLTNSQTPDRARISAFFQDRINRFYAIDQA